MKSMKETKHVWHLAQPTNRPLPSFRCRGAQLRHEHRLRCGATVSHLVRPGSEVWGYMEVS
jgi:hypothetical protein